MKLFIFLAFALTVFARESDESVLRSILAVLRSENSAEEQVSDHWMDSETENIIYMSDALPNWQNYRSGCGAKYQKEKAESTCCTFHSCRAVGFPGRDCQSCFWKCSDEKCIVGKHAQKNYYVAAWLIFFSFPTHLFYLGSNICLCPSWLFKA